MPDGNTILSVSKAMELLILLSSAGRAMTLKEIAEQSGFPKSTVFGLLTTMREYDVIAQTPDGKYGLGLRLFEFGCQVGRSWDISAVAKPYMEHLAADCGVSVMLSIREGSYVITLDQVEARDKLRIVSDTGARLPIYCTSQGKVFLASMPRAEAEKLLRRQELTQFTPHTVTDLTALMQEIDAAAAAVNKLGLSVISIYMGGGTPTTLTFQQLDRLCAKIAECFDLSALREYTVEAGRPDTITVDKLRTLRAHGVDRISVNPQTMSDKVLNVIGRRHTAADIILALEKVRKVGGMAVNMDLIAGLPADSAGGFEKTLDTVIALDPENITVHTLSLKKGSRITLEGSAIPSDAEVGKMLDLAQDRLRSVGWAPYYLYRQKFMSGGFENVGWSKPGSENLYNVCIMEELCSIIALGGGGSTKLISPAGGRNIRFFAPKYPAEYISGIQKTCSDKQGIIDFYSKESKK